MISTKIILKLYQLKKILNFKSDQNLIQCALDFYNRTIYGICEVFTSGNRIEKKKKTGRKCALNLDHENLICSFWKLNADATLNECKQYVESNPTVFYGAKVSLIIIDRVLKKHKVTYRVGHLKMPLTLMALECLFDLTFPWKFHRIFFNKCRKYSRILVGVAILISAF